MKEFKLVIQFALIIYWALSSTFAQESAISAGGSALGTEGTVNYSVGQTTYSYLDGLNGSINEGMQQPYEFFVVSVNDNKPTTIISVLYPNPTTSEINLRVTNYNDNRLCIKLNDLNGAQLLTQEICSENTIIPMSHLSPGNYFLTIINNSVEIKSFKIIKL